MIARASAGSRRQTRDAVERTYRQRLEADLARWQADGVITAASGDAIRGTLRPLPKGVDHRDGGGDRRRAADRGRVPGVHRRQLDRDRAAGALRHPARRHCRRLRGRRLVRPHGRPPCSPISRPASARSSSVRRSRSPARCTTSAATSPAACCCGRPARWRPRAHRLARRARGRARGRLHLERHAGATRLADRRTCRSSRSGSSPRAGGGVERAGRAPSGRRSRRCRGGS